MLMFDFRIVSREINFISFTINRFVGIQDLQTMQSMHSYNILFGYMFLEETAAAFRTSAKSTCLEKTKVGLTQSHATKATSA